MKNTCTNERVTFLPPPVDTSSDRPHFGASAHPSPRLSDGHLLIGQNKQLGKLLEGRQAGRHARPTPKYKKKTHTNTSTNTKTHTHTYILDTVVRTNKVHWWNNRISQVDEDASNSQWIWVLDSAMFDVVAPTQAESSQTLPSTKAESSESSQRNQRLKHIRDKTDWWDDSSDSTANSNKESTSALGLKARACL